jgi:hypothetical protein
MGVPVRSATAPQSRTPPTLKVTRLHTTRAYGLRPLSNCYTLYIPRAPTRAQPRHAPRPPALRPARQTAVLVSRRAQSTEDLCARAGGWAEAARRRGRLTVRTTRTGTKKRALFVALYL